MKSPSPLTDPQLAALFRGPELDSVNFDEQTRQQDDQLKIVYVWGEDCPNCIVAKTQMKEMLEELLALPVAFYSANAYEHRDLATRFGLFGIPVFFFFKNGRKIGRITSWPGRVELLETIRKHA